MSRIFSMFFHWLGKISFSFLLLWAIGFALFLWYVTFPASDNKKSFPITADSIVVLTGGEGRIEEGLRLVQQGVSKFLFVSGVAKGVRQNDLVQHVYQDKTENSEDVDSLYNSLDLGHTARDTRENAEEIRKWVLSFNQKRNTPLKKVIVVTSAYHMPRSLVELKEKMPDIVFVPYPVYSKPFKEEGWWRKRKMLFFTFREYNKYLVVEVRIILKKIKKKFFE